MNEQQLPLIERDGRYKNMTPERALEVATKAFEDAINTIHWCAGRNNKNRHHPDDDKTVTASIDHSRERFETAMDALRLSLATSKD